MKYKTIMWAEMKPDVYGGDSCDKIIPRFEAFSDGDRESTFIYAMKLLAKNFTPGTKIQILEPLCPKCGIEQSMCRNEDCDFDWDEWRDNKYS